MIPFNRPYLTGNEITFIQEAHALGQLAGDGVFTKRCERWIEDTLGVKRALLTHSCTAALEMAAIALDLKEGDEVIMPSYTFVSTANAVALRGAKPIFVDIRPDTLNIDEELIEEAITPNTRAVFVVHYGGTACQMDKILDICTRHGLFLVEDAAQALLSEFKGQSLGTFGHLATISFHETKNVISGEGGALLINDEKMIEACEIIREKGTDRSMFFRGEVDKYTWRSVGSSFVPGEIVAAFLWAQLQEANFITRARKDIWQRYYNAFIQMHSSGEIQISVPHEDCKHNAHIFFIILENNLLRDEFIRRLRERGVHTVFHYVPLHTSPMGLRLKPNSVKKLPVTESISARLVRLPIWIGLERDQDYIITHVHNVIDSLND